MIKTIKKCKEEMFINDLPRKESVDVDNYNEEVISLVNNCIEKESRNKVDITDENKLIDIFFDTRNLSKTKYKEETERLINDTKVYSNLSPLGGSIFDNCSTSNTKVYINLSPLADSDKKCDIAILNGGTLEVSNLLSKYYKVAALNFADGKKPGGWPEEGCLTQEENICRCSNMYEALISDKCNKKYYQVNRNNDRDGLCTDTVIYLPNVTIFKDDRDYLELESPFKYDIITCPAPSCHLYPNEALFIYDRRIEQIVLSAIKNNVECLVLGAWGCGAFRQDKILIARSFIAILNMYSGYFKSIVFAMKKTPGWNQKESAYNVFLNEFKYYYHGRTYYSKEI